MEYIISRGNILTALIVDYGLLVGIFIIIMVLMRRIWQRQRQDIRQQRQREATARAAQEAERQSKSQVLLPKSKVIPSKTRAPLGDPFGMPFVGSIQGHAAKWEAEIHQLGRQIIGQIDSKMAALQAITLDANRTANRLEILLEHLEQIARNQIEQQRAAHNTVTESSESLSTVIPAMESIPESTPLTDVLREIDGDGDLKGVRKAIRQSTVFNEQVAPATILRLAELQASTDSSVNIHGEVEMLANYGLEPQEIAQRLNISLGEVDIILQVQQNPY